MPFSQRASGRYGSTSSSQVPPSPIRYSGSQLDVDLDFSFEIESDFLLERVVERDLEAERRDRTRVPNATWTMEKWGTRGFEVFAS